MLRQQPSHGSTVILAIRERNSTASCAVAITMSANLIKGVATRTALFLVLMLSATDGDSATPEKVISLTTSVKSAPKLYLDWPYDEAFIGREGPDFLVYECAKRFDGFSQKDFRITIYIGHNPSALSDRLEKHDFVTEIREFETTREMWFKWRVTEDGKERFYSLVYLLNLFKSESPVLDPAPLICVVISSEDSEEMKSVERAVTTLRLSEVRRNPKNEDTLPTGKPILGIPK